MSFGKIQQDFVICRPEQSLQKVEEGHSVSDPRAFLTKPEKRFHFINNSNKQNISKSSTQVRRHVMREYMREMRWETAKNQRGYSQSSTTRALIRKPAKKDHHKGDRRKTEKQRYAASPQRDLKPVSIANSSCEHQLQPTVGGHLPDDRLLTANSTTPMPVQPPSSTSNFAGLEEVLCSSYSPSPSISLDVGEGFEQRCEEFITFLRCAEHLALVQAGMQSNSVSQQQISLRYSAFQPEKPLSSLLETPNGRFQSRSNQSLRDLSRMAALISLNTAIWEYRHSAEACEAFLSELLAATESNHLKYRIAPKELIRILLGHSRDPLLFSSERPWFVRRMMRVANCLGPAAFGRLEGVLLQYLTLGSELKPVVQEWEYGLRREISESPTKYET